MNVVVSTYAIGSLLPLSSSSVGRRLFFSIKPLERRIEKTEAESVEDIVAASSMAVIMPIPADFIVMPRIHQMAMPVSMVVSSTPTVASIIPGAITGFMSAILVSMPPENRMMHMVTVPIVCATL